MTPGEAEVMKSWTATGGGRPGDVPADGLGVLPADRAGARRLGDHGRGLVRDHEVREVVVAEVAPLLAEPALAVEAGQPVLDVGGVHRPPLLAVADDVQAEVDLPPHDVRDGMAEGGLERGPGHPAGARPAPGAAPGGSRAAGGSRCAS